MPTCPAPPDCSIPENYTISFASDPDIDGIGMIASFYTAAWLTIVLLAIAFFITGTTFDEDVFCELDQRFILRLHQLWRLLTPKMSGHRLARRDEITERVKKGLQTAILILSDQQLITSAAISIVGLSRHCTITEYHFHTVINLSLCASLAHSLTFPFVENHVMQNAFFRIWRAVAMLAVGALLMGTWIVTGSNDWLTVYGLPAQCGFDNLGQNFGPPATVSLGLLYWFLARGYLFSLWIIMPRVGVIKAIGLLLSTAFWLELICNVLHYALQHTVRQFRRSNQGLAQISEMRNLPVAIWVSQTVHMWAKKVIFMGISTILLFLISIVYSIAQCWRSYMFNLCWACYTLSGSATNIGTLRATAADNGMTGTESDWTFGQQLPMLMLFLPCAAIVEAFFDGSSPSTKEASSPSVSSAQDVLSTSQNITSGRSSIGEDLPSLLMQVDAVETSRPAQEASVRTPASSDNTSTPSFVFRRRIDTEQCIGLDTFDSTSDASLQRLQPEMLQSAAQPTEHNLGGTAKSASTATEGASDTDLRFLTLEIASLEDELWDIHCFMLLNVATFGALSYLMVNYGL